jgi:hypothetical protein
MSTLPAPFLSAYVESLVVELADDPNDPNDPNDGIVVRYASGGHSLVRVAMDNTVTLDRGRFTARVTQARMNVALHSLGRYVRSAHDDALEWHVEDCRGGRVPFQGELCRFQVSGMPHGDAVRRVAKGVAMWGDVWRTSQRTTTTTSLPLSLSPSRPPPPRCILAFPPLSTTAPNSSRGTTSTLDFLLSRHKQIVRAPKPVPPLQERSVLPTTSSALPVPLDECVACMDAFREIALMSCGHVVVCAACARGLLECPMCRTAVAERVAIAFVN